MRTRILASLCLLVAFLPRGVLAQNIKIPPAQLLSATPEEGEEDVEEEDAGGSSETEGAEVVDRAGPAPSRPAGGKEVAPGEVHTVTKGDTLWGLSQQYLGNSWYWPKVWSYNPEIVNPHWIYPGNAVRFFPAGPEAPTQVETGTPPATIEPVEEISPSDPLGGESAPPIQVAGPIGYQTKDPRVRIRTGGFVTRKEVEEAGRITGSFSEAVMLSHPDTAYVAFKRRDDVHIGDRYVVFRTESEVKHPVTGQRYGYVTQLLGTMRVISLSDNLVTAQIQDTWDAIQRDDLVGPYGEETMEMVKQQPNERELKGHVLTSVMSSSALLGEHHVIFIDKGRADGVQQGNTFVVVRRGNLGGNFRNPAVEQDRRFPLEDIAVCMAVDVKEQASSCLMLRSLREVTPGDQVEMRKASSGSQPVSQR